MSTKHTLGPWLYKASLRTDDSGMSDWTVYKPHVRADLPEQHIATMGIQGNEDVANARLISAAPEMLEAFKDLMHLIDSGYLVRNTDDDAKPNFAMRQVGPMLMLKRAMDAIIAAEGVES